MKEKSDYIFGLFLIFGQQSPDLSSTPSLNALEKAGFLEMQPNQKLQFSHVVRKTKNTLRLKKTKKCAI